MPPDIFFDSCILAYSMTRGERRQARAERLLSAGGTISVQCLNEVVTVARRKLKMPWEDIAEALEHIQSICGRPLPLTLQTHESAVMLAKRYGFQFYDCLIVASALEAGCTTLYTEDLQHNQRIGPLTVANPFLIAATH